MRQLSKRLSVWAVLMITICSTVFADEFDDEYEFIVDGIKYQTLSTSTVEVIFNDFKYTGDVVIPESVDYGGKTFSVTSIGEYAFNGCSLTSVTIPNSVTSIDYEAFFGCGYLTSVTIGNSVTSIGGYAFSYCRGLTSITIPNSVTSIVSSAFENCLLDSVTLLCPNVGSWFSGMNSLRKVVLGDGVTSIDKKAFSNCSSLTSVTIPNSVTKIGDGAFYGCSSLTSVTIPNSVTSIGSSAFGGCNGITSITIPNSVTSIGGYAFYGCSGLTSIDIPNSVTEIGAYAFQYCSGLTSVTIPNSVTSIGGYAFSGCPLESMTLLCPYVGSWFSGMNSLRKVVLGDGVTSIGQEAFSNCSNLTSVIIGNSVTSIGSDAFPYYANLKLLGEIPPKLSKPGYPYRYYRKIEVPKGSSWRYATAENWCETDTIFVMDGNRVLYPIPIAHEDISVIKVNGNADGTEAEENAEVEITVANNEYLPYSLIFCNNHEVTNSLVKDGKYVLRVSSNHKENLVSSYCYPYTDIALANSGTLIDQIGIDNLDTLECLKVSGDINGTDILTIRKMKNLKLLDLSDAHIVNGGMSYFENYTTSKNTIGEHFYDGLNKLLRIKLPNDIHEIKKEAFYGCSGLLTLTIPKSVKTMYFNWYYPLSSLISLQIEDLYSWCNINSTKYRPSNYIQECNIHLYLNDKEIVDLKIPDGITSIGYLAFCGCNWIKSVTIPSSVTRIESYAFWYCNNITTVTSLNPLPPEIIKPSSSSNYKTFDSTVFENATLYVPKGCKTIYWLHPCWENFKNIVEIDDDLVGDANSDGIVNAADIVEMVNYIIGKPSSTFNKNSADMNGDGVVNAVDVTLLIKAIK